MKVVLQTLPRARVASRTQSWGEGALPEAGERFVSAELGSIACRPSADVARWECFNALRMSTQKHAIV